MLNVTKTVLAKSGIMYVDSINCIHGARCADFEFEFVHTKSCTNFQSNTIQCSKLRVHPAPCVHNLAAGCKHFSTCAPGVCMFFLTL